MGEFNSDDHYILWARIHQKKWTTPIVNKRVQNEVLGYNLKNERMISVHFQGKPFNITVIQVYSMTSNAEEAEVKWFYEDLLDLLEITPKMSFSLQRTGMQKQEVKKYLEQQANLALEYKMKQGKG